MAVQRTSNAEFNKVYSLALDTIGSGLALEFDKPNQYKQINQLMISAISMATGGFKNGADDLFVKFLIVKGTVPTFVATTPPIPNPFPGLTGTEFDGQCLIYGFKNTSLGDSPLITFDPPLLFDPTQEVTVYFNNGYNGASGTQNDVIIAVTVLGEYIPTRNAQLTKEQYLNPKIK